MMQRDVCPTCGADAVVVGELRRGGHAMFASFEAADVASSYLMLPSHPGRLTPQFVASIFGDHALHGCFVSLTMPSWRSGIGSEPRELPS
jgi:hypothetical protein